MHLIAIPLGERVTDPSSYGGYTGNGCVGLMNNDALWFWSFLNI